MQETQTQQTPTQDPTAGMTYEQLLQYYERRREERDSAMVRMVAIGTCAISTAFMELQYMEGCSGDWAEEKRKYAMRQLAESAARMEEEWNRIYGASLFSKDSSVMKYKDSEGAHV